MKDLKPGTGTEIKFRERETKTNVRLRKARKTVPTSATRIKENYAIIPRNARALKLWSASRTVSASAREPRTKVKNAQTMRKPTVIR